MTEQTPQRKGGRPPLPPPPQNAADVRRLIAADIVRTNPSERRLRVYGQIIRAFERAEEAARMDSNNWLMEQANELKAAELERKRQDYVLRFGARPLGQRMLLQKVERLEAELGFLRQQSAIKSGHAKVVSVLDAGTFDAGDVGSNSLGGDRE